MKTIRFVLIISLVGLLSACNLGQAAPTIAPTLDLPTAEITAPTNNREVVDGTVFDIEILARDSSAGIAKVELLVDENLINEVTPEGQPVPVFAATMNWRAQGAGQHIIEVVPYRADGTRGDAARVTIIVLADENTGS
ncbi:MAG: Ig-like domain-containing protein [Aggregatilineales bacterium]